MGKQFKFKTMTVVKLVKDSEGIRAIFPSMEDLKTLDYKGLLTSEENALYGKEISELVTCLKNVCNDLVVIPCEG